MPIRKAKQINLLPQDDFQNTAFGRILKWALSTFRVMVIVTELVVMSAFLSRFWLDARNSDLNDSLNVAKARVLAYKDVEEEFRLYQKKLNIAKSIYLENKDSELVETVVKQLPEEVTLTSFQRTSEGIQIKAVALSERAIAQLLVNLTESKMFNDIDLSQVSSDVNDNFATVFTITAKIANKQKGATQ